MIIDTEKYWKLIKHMREEAQDYRSGKTLGRAFVDAEDVLDEAADAIGDLLAALDQPNEALTWSELAEMEGQPVYIVEMGARRYWALVIYVGKDTAYFETLNDPDDRGDKELYGESWVAYRRPKEERRKTYEDLAENCGRDPG